MWKYQKSTGYWSPRHKEDLWRCWRPKGLCSQRHSSVKSDRPRRNCVTIAQTQTSEMESYLCQEEMKIRCLLWEEIEDQTTLAALWSIEGSKNQNISWETNQSRAGSGSSATPGAGTRPGRNKEKISAERCSEHYLMGSEPMVFKSRSTQAM